jgi:hypothetical protein
MAFRFNLNTVDYSHLGSLELLVKLNNLRSQPFGLDYDAESIQDYNDKAEDIWSILYNRKQEDPLQFSPIEDLWRRADGGLLEDAEIEALKEGFLP